MSSAFVTINANNILPEGSRRSRAAPDRLVNTLLVDLEEEEEEESDEILQFRQELINEMCGPAPPIFFLSPICYEPK